MSSAVDVEMKKASSEPTSTAPTETATTTTEPETAYYDADFTWIGNNTIRSAAKTVYPAAYRAYVICDWIGEKVANGLGLTSSRFQYAVDEYHRLERKKQRKVELARQQELEAIREKGLLGTIEDDDDDDLPYVPPVVTQKVTSQQPLLADSLPTE